MAKCCLIFVTVKFNLVHTMKYQKVSKGTALLFLNLHDRRSMPHPSHFTPGERDPIPVVQEAIFVAVAIKSRKKAPISSAISFVFLLVMS